MTKTNHIKVCAGDWLPFDADLKDLTWNITVKTHRESMKIV